MNQVRLATCVASQGNSGDPAHLCSGRYRHVYQFELRPGNGYVIKKERAGAQTTYGPFPLIGDVQIEVPMFVAKAYYGIPSLNRHDAARYEGMRQAIKDHGMGPFFARVVSVEYDPQDLEWNATQIRVDDFDGKVSKNLARQGPISNDSYWRAMDRLFGFLNDAGISLNLEPGNLLVNWSAECVASPVIVDYKDIGPRKWIFEPGKRNGWRANPVYREILTRFML